MAWSGKRRAALALAALGALLAACGSNAATESAPEGAAGRLAAARITPAAPAAPGFSISPLRPDEVVYRLPLRKDGLLLSPVAEIADGFLVSATSEADGESPQRFLRWSPATGELSALWEAPTDRQDIVTGREGAWITVIRTGYELPFADWELQLRDLTTGEVRLLASGDPAVAALPALQPGVPLGFAPFAAIRGGSVVWAAYTFDAAAPAGAVVTVYHYDIAAGGEPSPLATLPAGDGVVHPVTAAGQAAWARATTSGWEAVVASLRVGTEIDATRTRPLPGRPGSLAFVAGDSYLAADLGQAGRLVLSLGNGEALTLPAGGWGVFGEGGALSWAPAGLGQAAPGFYLPTERVLRTLPIPTTNVRLLGGWFVWLDGAGSATGPEFRFARAMPS